MKINDINIDWYGWLLENMTFQISNYIHADFPLKTQFLNTDYIGASINAWLYNYNVSGIILQDEEGGYITPRFLSDIENHDNIALYYPYKLQEEQNDAEISLSWGQASWHFSHAGYDGCDYILEIGEVEEFSIAHRYNPAQLKTYGVAGSRLYLISIPQMTLQPFDHTINIYVGGSINPFNPGRLVHTQHLEEFIYDDVLSGGILLIYLDNYIEIPTEEELWIEIKIENYEPEYVSGDAHSLNLDGYGNLLHINGEWTTGTTIDPNFISNWSIMARTILPEVNISRGEITPNINFLGYHIYRLKGMSYSDEIDEFSLITPEPIQETTFTDYLYGAWQYTYRVYAVYDTGYSHFSEKYFFHNFSIIDTYPWAWSFDDVHPLNRLAGWTRVDNDDDNRGWSSPYYDYALGVVSNVSNSSPDNWLISPLFFLPSDQPIDFKYKTSAVNLYSIEDYSVFVSTTDTQIESFEEVFTETISATLAQSRTIDLSEYLGQSIYIAFRHYQSNYTGGSNYSRIRIGNFEIGSTYVSEKEEITPIYKTELHTNYPNPFNPSTTINFTLSVASNIQIDIFNIKGQKIKTLLNEYRSMGNHNVVWDGKNDAGISVSSGIYFYTIKTDNFTATRRMVLMK